jgi:hypothetical protein
MDFTKEIAELEEILKRYRNCVAAKEFGIATEVLAEWRQATYHALEKVANENYELGMVCGDSEAVGKSE